MSFRCSVIIPTRERPRQLLRCLECLAVQTMETDRYEVIVVDDATTGELGPVVDPLRSRIHLKLLKQEGQGPAAARNRGIDAAIGEVIAFADDDCEPRPEWLETLVGRVLAQEEPCMVGGKIVNLVGENPYSTASQLILDLVYDHYNHNPTDAGFFASMNVAAPRRALLSCGAFDPTFRTSEDRDLCDRWLAGGHRLVYEPRAEIAHTHVLDFRSFCRQHIGYGRGAHHFHRVRRGRASGTLIIESMFHLALPRLILRRLRKRRPADAATQLALLALWQVCNVLGFLSAWRAELSTSRHPD